MRLPQWFSFLVVVCLAVCGSAQALIINVPADQPTIQAGIIAAAPGDTVLVADGTYYEHIDFLGKGITVTSINGPASTAIDGGGSGYVVTFQSFEGRDSVIEKFTITNGEKGVYCLGVYDTQMTSPTIRGNVITSNTSSEPGGGGGVCCYYSGALIRQNVISGNSATLGGGIYGYLSDLLIEQNEITGNSATTQSGGGIYFDNCSGTIGRNTVTGNDADDHGGGLRILNTLFAGAPPKVVGNRISGNTASLDGGGLYIEAAQGMEIRDNEIADNVVGNRGGGLNCAWNRSYSISGNRITGNSAYEGGGLCATEGDLAISNNLIANNTAQYRGGGFFLGNGSSSVLLNNTIINNQAIESHGGGIFSFFSNLELTNDILFFNSAFFEHSDELRWAAGSFIHISNCDVDGGQSSVSVDDVSDLTWGPGIIDADPLLVDGPDGPACLGQTASGQASDSPCLDAGSGPASSVGYETTLGTVTMDQLSTRTDQLWDSGTVDLGWHNRGWPSNTVAAGLSCQPASGTLPLTVQFSVSLRNLYLAQSRRVAARVDAQLAGGTSFTNWRSGWTNLDRGETDIRNWPQNFPALGALVGVNQFSLVAVDVTPAPYNQPPYPPSGDTDTGGCAVTAAP